MKVFKFSETATDKPLSKITFEKVKEMYEKQFTFSMDHMLSYGQYRHMGWIYDFTDELKQYIVEFKDGQILKLYAPNKTLLRKFYGNHVIVKILDYS